MKLSTFLITFISFLLLLKFIDSHLNEIDALLSELNQLQNTLETATTLNDNSDCRQMHFNQATLINDFMTPIQTSNMNSFPISPSQINNDNEIEAIDQQFNEVLKFLAQSIDSGNKSSNNNTNSNNNNNQNGLDSAGSGSGSGSGSPQLSSPSPLSLSISTTTPNSDLANINSTDLSLLAVNHHNNHHIQLSKQNDRVSGGSINSNNSSGLGDEFYSNESSSISTKHSTSKLEESIHNLKLIHDMKNMSESNTGDKTKTMDMKNNNNNVTSTNAAKTSISSSKVISNDDKLNTNNVNNINSINDPRVVIRNVKLKFIYLILSNLNYNI